MKYIDEVILKRIDYGKGKGMYISTIALFSMQQAEMQKLQNTVTSLFSGETGNRVPLRPIQLEKMDKENVFYVISKLLKLILRMK